MIQVSDPELHRHSTRVYKLIAGGFVAVAAIIAAFTLYVVFSRATVVVLSEQQDIEADLIVDVAARPTDGEVIGGVYQLSKSVSETFTTSSIVTVDMKAEGRVRIESSLYRDQTLIASTRLLSADGKLFRIKDTVVVPGFGAVEVDVFSDETGTVNPLEEGAELTIPGLNEETQKFFTVKTVGTMSGGKKEVRLVTATDITKAEELLRERLYAEISGALREKAVEETAPMTGELFIYETTRSTSDVAAGEEAAAFTLTVAVNGQAVFYDRDAFEKRVTEMLVDRLPFDRMLTKLNTDATEMTAEKVDLIGKRANVRVQAHGISVLSPDAAGLDPQKLVGVTTDAAVQYLQTIDGVSSASVKMKPFWARRLPGTAEHITVEVR